MEVLPTIMTISDTFENPVIESMEQKILRNCEAVPKGTINSEALFYATEKALNESNIFTPVEKILLFIVDVFVCGGNREDLYRVIIKRAILDNIGRLREI